MNEISLDICGEGKNVIYYARHNERRNMVTLICLTIKALFFAQLAGAARLDTGDMVAGSALIIVNSELSHSHG